MLEGHRAAGERGQTSTEYLGMLVVIAAIIAVLVSSGIPAAIGAQISGLLCRVLSGPSAASQCERGRGGADVPDAAAPPGTDVDVSDAEVPDAVAPDAELPDAAAPSVLPGRGDRSAPTPATPLGRVGDFFAGAAEGARNGFARLGDLVGADRGDDRPATAPPPLPAEGRPSVPLALRERDRANRQAAADRLRILEADQRRLLEKGLDPAAPLERLPGTQSRAERIADLDRLIDSHRRMLADDVTLLDYDPSGEGRATAVIGDLRAADHVAIIVPGMGNSMQTMNGQIDTAQRVHQRASRLAGSESVATVVWLGYDAPDDYAQAAQRRYADAGDEALAAFARSVPRINRHDETAHVTVAGHSYGSLVAGRAAAQGMGADDLIVFGSPGTDAEHASELGDPAHVWAARTRDDPIRFVPGAADRLPGDQPPYRFGPDPSSSQFGARRFDTGDATGHSDYYFNRRTDRGRQSLENIARIIAGRPDEVELVDGRAKR